ncbi:MAG: dTMP kinase [Bacteroidales bacterium]|nr:dTMP kinase [Bacteroidales bacterium]
MFIVLEGLDGSGKSTQVEKLANYFEQKGKKTKFIHFPDTDSPVYGELVAKFLRGELGANDQVNPYLVALLYAGDRNHSKSIIEQWLEEGYVVVADRYVFSNIAFQCAKLGTIHEQDRLANWILETEYNYFKIPKPDLSIFLDVPPSFTQHQLINSRKGDDRTYLQGQADIHEQDLNFQQNVRLIYLNQIAIREKFKYVNCANEHKEMSTAEQIFDKLLVHVEPLLR